MKQIIAFLVFWISFLSCQSEEINIYTQHVKEVSKNKDGWNLVWSEEFDYEGLPDENTWGYEEGYQRNYEVQDYKKYI